MIAIDTQALQVADMFAVEKETAPFQGTDFFLRG